MCLVHLSFIEKLVLLQVCDALNRHNATIHSVLGKTMSLHPPHEESPHTDIWGEYKGMKFVANFVDAITEEVVEELIEEKRNSYSDKGLLCSKKTISTFLRAQLRQGDCEFVHVNTLPWRFGSREEKTFMKAFNSHFPVSVRSLFRVLIPVCESLMSSLQEGAVTDVIARGGAHSSFDFEQILFVLFPFLDPNKEFKVNNRCVYTMTMHM